MSLFLDTDGFREHWQGHRRLTRKVIEAFPPDQLFTFSIGGMRTFGALSLELVSLAGPMVRGVVHDDWGGTLDHIATAEEVLQLWDNGTAEIDALWHEIAPERFHEVITAFGQFTAPVKDHFLYVLDNEVHHRGQGYVYLRALGIEPPPFWER